MHLAAQDAGLPLLPGVMTPSDLIQAIELGYDIVKFFPAQQAGGVEMLKAFYGPFPNLRFCPTGGITAESAPDFLKQPNVVCVGGSWLTPKATVAAQDWLKLPLGTNCESVESFVNVDNIYKNEVHSMCFKGCIDVTSLCWSHLNIKI